MTTARSETTIKTALGAVAAVTLILLAFAWPTFTSEVRDMPLAVVGDEAQVQVIKDKLAESGAFDVVTVDTREDALTAIKQREVYGALVLGDETEVLTASAGSPAASQMLAAAVQKMGAEQAQAVMTKKQEAVQTATQAAVKAAAAQGAATALEQVSAKLPPAQAQGLKPAVDAAKAEAEKLGAEAKQAQAGLTAIAVPKTTVTDVVPLASTDARGAGLSVAGLPLTMGGMIGGVLVSLMLVGWKRKLAAIGAYGVLGGLAITLVVQSWFGFVQGGFMMNWLIIGCAIAATAAFITGCQALIGKPGIAVGAVLTLFIGNPISSVATPKEWLPGPWGEIGQHFGPGASSDLLRLNSYFPDASQLHPWLVLAGWGIVGVVLAIVGRHRDDETVHVEGAVEPVEG